MKEAQRNRIEQRLQEERERTQEALRRSDDATRVSSEEDGDLTSYPQHLADEGTDTMEQEKALLLMSSEAQRLTFIDEALRRLYQEPEQFGRCQSCGNEIAMERLELVPWAATCLDCQSRQEVAS